MKLSMPDLWMPPGEPREISLGHWRIAEWFWASPWGALVREENPADLTMPLLGYLTSSRPAGGLEASWSDPAGLRQLRDYLTTHRPKEGSPCSAS